MTSKAVKFGVICFIIVTTFLSATAQTEAQKEAISATGKALTLFQQERYEEAIPHLEIAIKTLPDIARLRFMYGVALLAKSKRISDNQQAKLLSALALDQFKKAKELGIDDPSNDAFIKLLGGSTDGEEATETSAFYSKNPEAEKLMGKAEEYFTQSKLDEAIEYYQKALAIDPKIYQAATGAGDAYTMKEDWAKAEQWYQKAIAIDPNRETAYRYSATPLMKQEKYDEALVRYIEALITEPYSNMSPRGISQWAQITGARLGHPKVDIPEVKYDSNGKVNVVMNENSLTEGSKAWLAYSLTREKWHKEKFAQTFPKEAKYRHTLQEETEAIRSVLKMAKEQNLSHPQFETLQKLDNDGLLEAFILMAHPDEDLAGEHAEYLKNNRPKLRQYVLNYVVQK